MTDDRPRIFIGWDAAQMAAWLVAEKSIHLHARQRRPSIDRLALPHLRTRGLYWRPTRFPTPTDPGYFDEISQAPMSTGHAIARFLVPYLTGYCGWALFVDGDILVRRDVDDLFALADSRFAVQVVQHQHAPAPGTKMEGAVQTSYARKNWSSVMLFNCGHSANRVLLPDLVNSVPGRDLHRFGWLDDALIGALPPEWNFLVGTSSPSIDPALVHFTEGVPNMPGYEHVPFADEWYAVARACGYRFTRPAEARRA